MVISELGGPGSPSRAVERESEMCKEACVLKLVLSCGSVCRIVLRSFFPEIRVILHGQFTWGLLVHFPGRFLASETQGRESRLSDSSHSEKGGGRLSVSVYISRKSR